MKISSFSNSLNLNIGITYRYANVFPLTQQEVADILGKLFMNNAQYIEKCRILWYNHTTVVIGSTNATVRQGFHTVLFN